MKSFQEYLKDNNPVSEVTGMNVGKTAYGTASFSNSEAEQLTHMMKVVDMAISENPQRFMNALRGIASNNPEMELLISNINLPKLKMAAKKHVEDSESENKNDSMHGEEESKYLPKGM
jgi:hypothetical protein